MKMTIKKKILLFIIIPTVLFYSFIIMFHILGSKKITTKNTKNRLSELAGHYSNHFDNILREVAQTAEIMADHLEGETYSSSDQFYSLLKINLKNNRCVYGSAVAFEPYKHEPDRKLFVKYVYREGDTLHELDPSETGYDYTDIKQDYWHIPRNTKKAVWTDPYFDEGAGNILMSTYSVPFFKNGTFQGIATVDIPLKPIREMVETGISKDVSFSIITQTGKFVYSKHNDRINKTARSIWDFSKSPEIDNLIKKIVTGKSGFTKVKNWDTNELDWVFYTPIRSTGWGFVLSITEEKATLGEREQFQQNILILIISLLVLIISLWYISIKFSTPIVRLNKAMIEVSNGNKNVKAIVDSNDEIGELAIAFNQMTEQISDRENSLKESEARFRRLAENAKDAIYRMKLPEGIYEYMSPASVDIFGYSPIEFYESSVLIQKIIHPDWHDYFSSEWEKLINGEMPPTYEYQIIHKSGEVRWLNQRNVLVKNDKGDAIAIEAIVTDVTEQKNAIKVREKLEFELRHVQKMEAIGTLAGGIAHDFNNILSVIMGNADLAREIIMVDGNLPKKEINAVIKACKRAKELVSHIVSFTRKSEVETTSIQINLVLKETLKLIQSTTPTTIEIKQKIDSECGNIYGNPTQINQVIMNLCTNAAQAMDESGGVLSIELSCQNITKDDLRDNLDLKIGKYVKLSVGDTGEGIEQEIIDRIFDPYFTTKEIGKGSGMGLAIVHGIVTKYNGAITVDSVPGKGTTFNIFFPMIPKDVKENSQEIDTTIDGSERVLLIDDDENVLKVTKIQLERLGYQVTALTSSTEAYALFKSSPNDFDIVITDQTMSQMTGKELSEKILDFKEDIPIILCSGYSNKIDPEIARKIGIKAFLMKPIVFNELPKTIRMIMNDIEQ